MLFDHIGYNIPDHFPVYLRLNTFIKALQSRHFSHYFQTVIVLPVIVNILVDSLDLLSHIVLPRLLILVMSFRQDQSCKKCYVICINLELALLDKVVYRLWRYLEVFARLLQVRHWLSIGIKGPEPMKLLIKTVDNPPVKVVHPHEHLLPYLRVCSLHLNHKLTITDSSNSRNTSSSINALWFTFSYRPKKSYHFSKSFVLDIFFFVYTSNPNPSFIFSTNSSM